MAGNWDESQQRMRAAKRQASDGLLAAARELCEVRKSGVWREHYATFDACANDEMDLLPGQARELVRVQRKLEAAGVDSVTAHEIGWEKLQIVSARLNADNRDEILKELKVENVQTLRDKYRPRTCCPSRRQTPCTLQPCTLQPCTRQEPACHERETPPQCCLTERETVPSAESRTREASQPAADPEPAGRMVGVTPFFEVALGIARRQFQHCSEADCLNAICAIFISLMGSESEKQWIKSRLAADLAKPGSSKPLTASPEIRQPTTPVVESRDESSVTTEASLNPAAGSKKQAPRASRSATAALRRKRKQERRRRRH